MAFSVRRPTTPSFDLPALMGEGAGGAYAGIGSRETPADVCADMTRIAAALERRDFRLRSGGARGADDAFERGVAKRSSKEIYLPWAKRESDSPLFPPRIAPDRLAAAIEAARPGFALGLAPAGASDIDIVVHARLIAEELYWRPWQAGGRWDEPVPETTRALMSRNGHQVLGMRLNDPVRFVIAWTKDGGPSGGTGQAIRLAERFGIPVLNLHDRALRSAILAELGL